LCIDPLISNINANKDIKGIPIGDKGAVVKCGGYADDIYAIMALDLVSIQNLFLEYEKLTQMSGLELNADKTELLVCRRNDGSREDDRRQPYQQAMPVYQQAMPEYHRARRDIQNIISNIDGHYLMKIKYLQKAFVIKSVDQVKICGIVFSKQLNIVLEKNISDKITKLEMQLKRWKCRNLNMLAKILIVKTFGLSQLNIKCNAYISLKSL
jgi:hypothetical protein